MKSSWFRNTREYQFAKLIVEAGEYKGLRTHELFDKFLFCAYAALRQAVHKLQEGEIDAKLEAEYLRAIQEIPSPAKFSDAMGELVHALEENPCDFLGNVYQSIGMADKDFRGQCFTPASICELLARMTLNKVEPNPHHRLTIQEPCVGGGAMVIAAQKILIEKKYTPLDYFFWCTDVARSCFHMAYVQLTLLGVPAIITCGDSLWPQPTDISAPTIVAALHPYRKPREEKPVIFEEPKDASFHAHDLREPFGLSGEIRSETVVFDKSKAGCGGKTARGMRFPRPRTGDYPEGLFAVHSDPK